MLKQKFKDYKNGCFNYKRDVLRLKTNILIKKKNFKLKKSFEVKTDVLRLKWKF